jgi:hypothetical protein
LRPSLNPALRWRITNSLSEILDLSASTHAESR